MAAVPTAGEAFFPLDEELVLLPGCLTPRLQERLTRLGSWLPFRQAAEMLGVFTQVTVSGSTAHRLTLAAGGAQVELEDAALARIEQGQIQSVGKTTTPKCLSVDGAMAPLVGGVWGEVRTLAISEPMTVTRGDGVQIGTVKHTYFSRLTDAECFQRRALVEMERRQVWQAEAVASVSDGAKWIQTFIDFHAPDAIRILDFPHAAERFSQIEQRCAEAGVALPTDWATGMRHQLKQAGAAPILAQLQQLQAEQPVVDLTEPMQYLANRQAMMAYPQFQADGWPIGSGNIESANKLVVEARLKGSGMHWLPDNVNPMLALRNTVCNDRWAETWPAIHRQRRVIPAKPDSAPQAVTQPAPNPLRVYYKQMQKALAAENAASDPQPEQRSRRPAANHPWRRMPVGRALFRAPSQPHAKK